MISHPIESAVARQPSASGGWLLCVSGGADSMALLHAAVRAGVHALVAHCNFCLRGAESDRDEQAVRDACRALGVECIVRRFDTKAYCREHGVSLEMGCRELRYDWFRSLKREHSLSRIVVAHNADDNTETMLLNLLRGTGVRGLTAMCEDTGEILRPLLSFSRAEIVGYLEGIGVRWVTDSSNLTSDFKRNFLRNDVLPLLRTRWPELDKTLARTREHLADTQALAEDALSRYMPDVGNLLRFNDLHSCPAPETLVYEWLRPHGINKTQPAEMLGARAGASWRLPGGVVERTRFGLLFTNPDEPPRVPQIEVDTFPNTAHYYELCVGSAPDVCYCSDTTGLHLRLVRSDDYIAPLGMGGKRVKVQKALKDAGLSPLQRARFFLLADAEDRVIWLPGIRRSIHRLVTPDSPQIFRLKMI